MRRVLPLKVALMSLVIGACVTINVYFPAAAAEKAADQYWNDVTRGATKGDVAPTQAPPQSHLVPANDQPGLLVAAIGGALYALVPAAHAQDADAAINTNSPAVSRIKTSMASRLGGLEKFFASGSIGLTKDGMLDVRDLNSVALPDRATLKRLVAEDNADRAQLYAEIAKANGHPEWEDKIRGAWTASFVRNVMKPGWYYQDDSGAWKQK
ncbi:MAG TPA: DUF1318 domain-containing protein [Steroidobacteraceae bacterium]|nr:DUF1318 domain-containing protein [Steroidobacteraceae bacterium]